MIGKRPTLANSLYPGYPSIIFKIASVFLCVLPDSSITWISFRASSRVRFFGRVAVVASMYLKSALLEELFIFATTAEHIGHSPS